MPVAPSSPQPNGFSGETPRSWRTIILARDYQSLSLFRILFALYLGCYFFFEVWPYYNDFYTDQGVLPRPILLAVYPSKGLLSLLVFSDYRLFHALFIAAHVASIVLFGIGYKTRWSNFVLFATYTSLVWRNPMVSSGAEILAKLLLLWSLFLPMARYWSVDAALDPEPRDRFYPLIPFLGIRMQISLLYFCSALYKLAGAPWRDGSAVAMALEGNIFGGTPLGLWTVRHFADWLWLPTYGIVIFQLLFSVLICCPWRNNLTRGFALLIAACMHISFLFMLNVGFFPYICLAYLVVLVPDGWWDALLAARRARLGRIRIFYDPGCEFCKKTALLFREFCLSPGVGVLPADQDAAALALLRQNNSWVVYDVGGRPLLHWRAVAYVLRQNPLLWIFGALTDLPPLRPAMKAFYGWIGARRPLWGKITRVALPIRAQPALGAAATGFCAFLMLLSLAFVVSDTLAPAFASDLDQETAGTPGDHGLRARLADMAALFQVAQRWNIFAPAPPSRQTRLVLTGIGDNGTPVDLAGLWSPPLFYLEPNGYSVGFASHRWRKYFWHLKADVLPLRRNFARYVCRRANGGSGGGSGFIRIVHFEVLAEPENTPWRDDAKPQISLNYSCPPPGQPAAGITTGVDYHAF